MYQGDCECKGAEYARDVQSVPQKSSRWVRDVGEEDAVGRRRARRAKPVMVKIKRLARVSLSSWNNSSFAR